VSHARVIVATYEQLPALRLALRGYLRQTTADFSLVVADDGSGEDTRRFLEGFAERAREAGIPFEHHRQEDRGFRKTRILNECIRRAEEETLFVFSDGDCIPPARFVERHLAVHEPLSFHVGGAVRLGPEASATLDGEAVDRGDHETLAAPADRRDLARRARKSRWGTLLRRRNRPKVLGLNMAFDRTLLQDLNGFDERFEGYGYEDSDLRDRAMRHRPRPRVKVLYGTNDVVHLWHGAVPGGRAPNRAYYRLARPVRCERGLVRADAGEGDEFDR
jgi:GT2 family glycosyltransferase